MGERLWMSLGVGFLVLVLPASAQAAIARARVLNAGPSGAVTFTVDGKTRAAKVAARGVSKRFSLAAGFHTFAAKRGATTVATRTIGVKRGERLTVVYALSGGQPLLQLLREPGGVGSGTLLRVANYAGNAGPVDVRVGPLTIAQALGPGHTTVTRRLTSGLSATGQIAVSARRTATGGTFTASQKLVLATRSVGLFALVPTPAGARLIRLPYDVTPPTPKALPKITGTRRFGHTVGCGAGSWTPKASRVSRRWTLDGVALPGGASLKLSTAANAGHVLGCAVSASSRGMTTRVRTTFALPDVPTPIVPPAILVPGGALQTGDVATCDVGKWRASPTDFAFRWVRVATQQVVGTGDTYTLSLARDNGLNNVVVCEVTATNDGGASTPAESQNSVALNVAPTIAIRTGPPDPQGSSTFAFFTFAIGGGGADTVSATIDGFTVPASDCNATGCQVTFGINVGPGRVSHTFVATAVNGAGPSAPATFTWGVNPPLPTISVFVPPADHTLNPVPFSWSPGGGTASSAECSVDDGPFTTCTGATTASANVVLPDALPTTTTYKIQIRAVNAAGPSTPVTIANWALNPVAPGVTLDPPTPTDGNPTFSWTQTGGAADVTCRLDVDGVLGTPATCTSPTSFSGLVAGPTYTFTVSVANVSGSGSASASWSF